MDHVVVTVLAAIEARDWERLKPLLHPYLHWTGPDGGTVRGRTKILRLLADRPLPGPPARYELRDEQVYRWVEGGG